MITRQFKSTKANCSRTTEERGDLDRNSQGRRRSERRTMKEGDSGEGTGSGSNTSYIPRLSLEPELNMELFPAITVQVNDKKDIIK
eukprot:763025-Hanusia_phi.AAC.4